MRNVELAENILQIFVRHGSQVEEPTPDELKSLIDEAKRVSELSSPISAPSDTA